MTSAIAAIARDRREHRFPEPAPEEHQRHSADQPDDRADQAERRRPGSVRGHHRRPENGSAGSQPRAWSTRHAAPTGSRTSAGSTPKTLRIRLRIQRRRGRAVGRRSAPAARTTTRGKKWAASARSWRTARIVVPSRRFSSSEELHDLDLMADVEVRRRLIEDQDRRRLGDGDGDEHELPLAHRQLAHVALAQVADADAVDRPVDCRDVGRAQTGHRRLMRQAPERHDLVDRHRERQVGDLGHDRDRPGERSSDRRARWGRRAGRPTQPGASARR